MQNAAIINPETLKLIRETKNVSIEYIANKFKKINDWETGSSYPTINQAKELAKRYNIPFAALYMKPEHLPLKKLPQIKNRRRVYGANTYDDSALYLALYEILRLRELVFETKELLDESIDIFQYKLDANNVQTIASQLRLYLGYDENIQKKTRTGRQSFIRLRNLIENKGILICGFKVDRECARGLSLYYNSFPIIGFNEHDTYTAKMFTLAHELVHIVRHNSTLCNEMFFESSNDNEEQLCNAVAGELLVPTQSLYQEYKIKYQGKFSDDNVLKISYLFSVSREVIIRRLLDLDYIKKDLYELKFEQYTKEFLQLKELIKKKNSDTSFGRNMGREAFDTNGSIVCNSMLSGYSKGFYDELDISRYLNIKDKNVSKLFEEVQKW